jgi:hypothetical protein
MSSKGRVCRLLALVLALYGTVHFGVVELRAAQQSRIAQERLLRVMREMERNSGESGTEPSSLPDPGAVNDVVYAVQGMRDDPFDGLLVFLLCLAGAGLLDYFGKFLIQREEQTERWSTPRDSEEED